MTGAGWYRHCMLSELLVRYLSVPTDHLNNKLLGTNITMPGIDRNVLQIY
jgi:hypothetical protein